MNFPDIASPIRLPCLAKNFAEYDRQWIERHIDRYFFRAWAGDALAVFVIANFLIGVVLPLAGILPLVLPLTVVFFIKHFILLSAGGNRLDRLDVEQLQGAADRIGGDAELRPDLHPLRLRGIDRG